MISKKEAKAILKDFPGLKFACLSPSSTDKERSFTAQLRVYETRNFNDKEYSLVGHFKLSLPEFVVIEDKNVNFDFEITHLSWQYEYPRGSEEWNYAWDNNISTYETVDFESTTFSDHQLQNNFETLYLNEETLAQIMMLVGAKIEKNDKIILPSKIKM